jgi:hypothetical protein
LRGGYSCEILAAKEPDNVTDNTVFDLLEPLCLDIQPVGSRVTCVPAPANTDQDFLLLVTKSQVAAVDSLLSAVSFEVGGSRPGNTLAVDALGSFRSYKHDDINFIITTDMNFFSLFMAATSVAKRLNLMNKADRIALFQAVLYGNECDA